jgi:hypothetical protein
MTPVYFEFGPITAEVIVACAATRLNELLEVPDELLEVTTVVVLDEELPATTVDCGVSSRTCGT